jgi:mannose-6-phosphate isomerase
MTGFDPPAPRRDDTLGDSDLIFPLRMKPHFDPKPWGGRRLKEVLGKDIPEGKIGESWEISTTGGKVSHVDGGPLDGLALDEVLRRWPVATMGRLAGREFPLLVKFIDASENLSVQVHPDDKTARRLEDFPRGKTESWVILEAGDGAELIHGLMEGTTREALAKSADSPGIEMHLRRVPIRRGTVAPVTAGTVHAILAGTLLCEVQQASDITYRLYDWNRKPPRPLHIEQSLESIPFGEKPPDLLEVPPPADTPRRPRPFLDMGFFTLAMVDVPGTGASQGIDLGDGDFALGIVLDDGGGEVELVGRGTEDTQVSSVSLRAGHSVFIPAAVRGVVFRATAATRVLWVRPGAV